MNGLLTITRLTLRELRSSKLVVLPLTVAIAIVLVATNIENPSAHGTDLLLGMWGGLAVVGSLVAILAASGAISGEIERGTMLLLAARPVSRTTIVLGKLLGIAIYLALCTALWAVLLSAGMGTRFDEGPWVMLGGALLAFVPMLLATSVALVASALFPTRGAIGSTIALWLAALIVAAVPLSAVRAGNRERVELAQQLLGWALPQGRLNDFPDAALTGSIPAGSWAALLVVGAWLATAVVIVRLRSSLSR